MRRVTITVITLVYSSHDPDRHVMVLFYCAGTTQILGIDKISGVNSVRIINMRVPEVIQYGTKDRVTLDCDYITNNVTGLVVKWFYMDKSQPVYQWIPPQKPQALGILKNKLDLNYKVSHNPYTQSRALRVIRPDPELTGNYTCVVSTFLAEDDRTRPMTIFVPEKRFDMIQDRLNDGYLNIICTVEGVFPKPELVILAGNRPLVAKSSVKLIGGRYTALTSAVVKVEALPPTVEILCDMQVPLANYLSRKRDIFYRDPPPNEPESPNSASKLTLPYRDVTFGLSSAMLSSILLHLINAQNT